MFSTTHDDLAVADPFRKYTQTLEAAKRIADSLKGRRVRYTPFGRHSEHVGRIASVRTTGVLVKWDDPHAFWHGSQPYPLNPSDLTFIDVKTAPRSRVLGGARDS